MKKICYILFMLFSFVACNEDVFENHPPRLVVEGWIDDGGFPVVIVTESVPISSQYADISTLNDRVIKWAKVTVSDGVDEVILTGKTNSSYFPPYIYTTSHMRGESGKRYKLTVSYEEHFVEAETEIPERVYVERFITDNSDGNYNLKAVINDNPDEKNYYKFFVRMIDRDSMYLSSNMAVVDDANFEFPLEIPISIGKSIQNKEDDDYQLDGSEMLLVKFTQTDSIAYNFWNEYKNYIEVGQNSIFRYTNNVYSNIKGGMGYWFGYGATQYLCQPYNHDTPKIIN